MTRVNLARVASALAALAFCLAAPAQAADSSKRLQALAQEWRAFAMPEVESCLPDYSAPAMAEKAKGLEEFQRRLAAIDRKGWKKPALGDYAYVEAEMNAMDFDLRVLKPFARDPSFYASVFADQSDTPDHEGPSAFPPIDLYTYQYPLSPADQQELTCLIGAVPALLEQAKENLAASNARDLWLYGGRAFRWQDDALAGLQAGTLDMRTLEGNVRGGLDGASPALKDAVAEARRATQGFIAWIEAEAPSKTGPSGVGKDNYDWYMKHVRLSPYGWAEEATLLRRELDRARASLAIEEFRNRALPPLAAIDEPEAWRAMATAKMQALVDFLIDNDLVADKEYFRDAMANEVGAYAPPDARNFFDHGAARDPSALYSHFYHWIELARRKHEPSRNSIRAATPLHDIYSGRSEGMATAVEELFMQAGLYEDSLRSREIVWVMLANRAARGLASLYVQSNDMTLAEAGQFHAAWTPWKWSDPESDLVGFEQLLYLRQPGYGTSYIAGKLELDRLISDYAFAREQQGEAFSLPEFFRAVTASDIVPFSLIGRELVATPLTIGADEAR